MVVQAIWARKVHPRSPALALYIAGIVFTVFAELLNRIPGSQTIAAVMLIGALVLIVVASFSVRDTLGQYITRVEGRPTYLSGVMTIFLGPIYLQYHMNKVRAFEGRVNVRT